MNDVKKLGSINYDANASFYNFWEIFNTIYLLLV